MQWDICILVIWREGTVGWLKWSERVGMGGVLGVWGVLRGFGGFWGVLGGVGRGTRAKSHLLAVGLESSPPKRQMHDQ